MSYSPDAAVKPKSQARTPTLSWALAVLIGLLIVSCSRMVRLEVRLHPPQTEPLDTTKLHIVGAKSCPPGLLPGIEPNAEKSDAEFYQAKHVDRGVEVIAAFRGGHCTVQLAAWYDTNGNGRLDAGDLKGTSEPVEGTDEGLCSGNLVKAPEVTLASIP
jgi:hypothetical protein